MSGTVPLRTWWNFLTNMVELLRTWWNLSIEMNRDMAVSGNQLELVSGNEYG